MGIANGATLIPTTWAKDGESPNAVLSVPDNVYASCPLTFTQVTRQSLTATKYFGYSMANLSTRNFTLCMCIQWWGSPFQFLVSSKSVRANNPSLSLPLLWVEYLLLYIPKSTYSSCCRDPGVSSYSPESKVSTGPSIGSCYSPMSNSAVVCTACAWAQGTSLWGSLHSWA